MINKEIREKKISSIKKDMVKQYIYIMCSVLTFYTFLFMFYLKDTELAFYCALATVFLFTGWLIFRNKVKLEILLAYYLLTAPLFCTFSALRFWETTASGFAWLIPIPFGAYIFYKNKIIIYYYIYIVLIIIFTLIVVNFYDFNFPLYDIKKVRTSEVFIIIFNFFIISFLVYYKAKIRELEIISEIEEKEKISLPVSLDSKDIEMFNKVFSTIEEFILVKENFKDSKLTISFVSSQLNINNNYLSKAIRLKGYSNFNHYINTIRVNHAKKLLSSENMDKLTLLYIYTESGFTSQSTFNRVFKQIEEITPSEFMKSLE